MLHYRNLTTDGRVYLVYGQGVNNCQQLAFVQFIFERQFAHSLKWLQKSFQGCDMKDPLAYKAFYVHLEHCEVVLSYVSFVVDEASQAVKIILAVT